MGLIEKVIVPSNRKKSINAMVKCFRLVTPEESPKRDEEEGVIVQVQEADDDDGSPLGLSLPASRTNILMSLLIGEPNGVKMNLSIHKQILNLLEESGTMGMTLNVNGIFLIYIFMHGLLGSCSCRNSLLLSVILTNAPLSSFSHALRNSLLRLISATSELQV